MSRLLPYGKKNNAGFTLVEMIVVLIVLGILASVAVYGISAYIDMTRFNKNEENAASIFQSAQLAVNHMEAAGTAEEFALKVLATDTDTINTSSPFDPNNFDSDSNDNLFRKSYFDYFTDPAVGAVPGQSVHMRYALTYTPEGSDDQSKIVYDLISADFRSTDIFSGVITIEFDVEKALDNMGELHYSVNVYSVFCDAKRSSWDDVARNNLDSPVPFRDSEYRRKESLVGYYRGVNTSAVVDTVFIPADQEIKNTFFTLRNGETLDMTWSSTADNAPITGRPAHIHYHFSLYDHVTDTKFCDLIVSENAILSGIPTASLSNEGFGEADTFYDKLKFSLSGTNGFDEGYTRNVIICGRNYTAVDSSERILKDHIEVTIYRRTIHTVALVYVNRSNKAFDYNASGNWSSITNINNYFEFPLSISYEIHDGDGVSDRISYTLSLDSMMSANVITAAENQAGTLRTLNYSISRLLPRDITAANLSFVSTLPKNGTPFARNFYATMVAEPDLFVGHDTYNDTTGFAKSDIFTAERALDDPVYRTAQGIYDYDPHAAFLDASKGHAVVNAYFGDLTYGSFSHDQNAVITSFRHLSNTRLLRDYGGEQIYSIARDLDWYTITKNSVGKETHYSSEVIVYSLVGGKLEGHSPVEAAPGQHYGDSGTLKVVSFPSLQELDSKATLIAADNTISTLPSNEDRTSVINNVQMRMPSFYSYEQAAYGLICENFGTVINVRGNGFTLTMDDIPDGSEDDRNNLKAAVVQMINDTTPEVSGADQKPWKSSSPVGGLIGANNGYVGSRDSSLAPEDNTVRLSNCLIMSGEWFGSEWRMHRVSACSIIIGDNNGNRWIGGIENRAESTYGHFEVTGQFVSAGCIYVGTVIGYCKSNVDGLIKVDNSLDTDKAIIDLSDTASSLVFGMSDAVGGAVGSLDGGRHFCQDISASPLSYTLPNPDGTITVSEVTGSEYAVDVRLTGNSYIILHSANDMRTKEDRDVGVGGAIGRIDNYSGPDNKCILSIRVINEGSILSSDGKVYYINPSNGNVYWHDKHVGGAVGFVNGGSLTGGYIHVRNSGMIGTTNGNDFSGRSYTTGGAIGRIYNFGKNDGEIIISVINNCPIFGYDDRRDKTSVGGCIGRIDGSNNNPRYIIATINNKPIKGKMLSGTESDAGVGGAVGFLDRPSPGSIIYCKMAEGSSITSSGNNAGGVIGCHYNSYSTAPGSNMFRITAELCNGVSVTANADNSGGAIGYDRYYQHNTDIRTVINGRVTINASSCAGGCVGTLTPRGDISGASIILRSISASSVLTIKTAPSVSSDPGAGNDNAGGLVGSLDAGTSSLSFDAVLSLPSQTGSDILSMKIDCFNNAGGFFGNLYGTNISISSSMDHGMHPDTYIHARGTNAGGAIGRLETGKTVSSDISLNSVQAISASSYITADQGNAGGLIGQSARWLTQTGQMTVDLTGIPVSGTDNIGGCIGNVPDGFNMTGDMIVSGSNIEITGNNQVGGCIGRLETQNGSGGITLDGNMTVLGSDIKITGYDQVGGCIGYLRNCRMNAGSVISFTSDNAVISGRDNTGGCIGMGFKNNGNNTLDGRVEFAGNNIAITGTGDNTGGLFGLLETPVGGNAEFIYSASDSKISGENNVGGLIGKAQNHSSSATSVYTYSASETTIKAAGDNAGGIIGYSYNYANYSVITVSCIGNCSVTGDDNIGGCVGRIEKNGNNFHCIPEINLNGSSSLTVSGTGYTGGIAGYILDSAGYWGSTVILNDSSRLNVISSASASGGHIGYMTGMTLGSGAELYTYCRGSNTMTVTGASAAGGLVGLNNGKLLPEHIIIDLTNESSLNVTATASGSGAGGYCGINNYSLGRNGGSLTFCSGSGNMNIRSDNGYAGSILGINNNIFGGTTGDNSSGNTEYKLHNLNVTSGQPVVDPVLGGNYAIDKTKYTFSYI